MMNVSGFPTSSDIYLEADGKKIAVVQSYTAKATKTSQTIEAFIPLRQQKQARPSRPSAKMSLLPSFPVRISMY